MRALRVLPLVLALLTTSCLSTLAYAERRTALVIGNGAYKTAPLKNPTNDAQDMASALREMGFDVTLKVNVNHRDMEEAVRSFGAKLKHGGLGLFYYAGHGVQVAGENYLIPVDTKVDAEADVKFGALNAGMVLARMEDAGNGLNIVILDACRTNPFSRSFRTAEQGLARMDAPKGSLIAYATAPGRVAADSVGSGRNGVYTGFLLRHMRTPGLKVEEALKNVRADVVRVTSDKQVPWESSSLIGDFYFVDQQVNAAQDTSSKTIRQDKSSAATPNPSPIKAKKNTHQTMVPNDWLANGLKASQNGNHSDAAKWFQIGADSGDARGQFLLAACYTNGSGVSKDLPKAYALYMQSAEQGYVLAQTKVGTMLTLGHGVEQNHIEAARWFAKAADRGDAQAQHNLGTMFYRGIGIKRDYADAFELFKLSAEQDYPLAQFNLALMYYTGQGTAKNDTEAARWFLRAAEYGETNAQRNLGLMYADGAGVPKSYKIAHMWLAIAASNGDSISAKNKSIIESRMSQSEIRESQNLASSWVPKPRPQ